MSIFVFLWNIFLAYASFFICRIVYILKNWDSIGIGIEELDLWKALHGAFLFDTSTICSTLCLYCILMLLPIPLRKKDWYQSLCKWYYMVIMGLGIIINLADSVYFPYAERRTTVATLVEFKNESVQNMLKITGIEAAHNWYLFVIAAILIYALSRLYRKGGDIKEMNTKSGRVSLRIISVIVWLLAIPLLIGGYRGGFTRKTSPINIGYAMRYVNTPAQAAGILNTSFTMIRNLFNSGYKIPEYMTEEEMNSTFSPVHHSTKGTWTGKSNPNVVIMIVESLSQEFIGTYNDYTCHTPFLDSLRSVSLSPTEAFANGNKSIDALPSILSSIPRMEEHLFTTPYANDRFCSIVFELSDKGYDSGFFHGSQPGSMGFDAYADAVGTRHTYSASEYSRDKRFNGMDDFDGQWAIWDEEFLQFTALHTEGLKEPFICTVFTASSHHPFVIPDKYKDCFNLPGHPMYNCISYTDYALRKYFETASRQAWYDNTIFILTADHASPVTEQKSYSDDLGSYRIPLMIFDPSGTLPRGIINRNAQQIDIFPTLMGILGTDRDYIAFGKDFLNEEEGNWAYLYKEIHLFKNSDRHISFDGENVKGNPGKASDEDLRYLKAFIQSYKSRMIQNNMRPKQ